MRQRPVNNAPRTGVTGASAMLSAMAPNLPSTNVRSSFRRAVVVRSSRDAVSPSTGSNRDAVSPGRRETTATTEDKENSQPLETEKKRTSMPRNGSIQLSALSPSSTKRKSRSRDISVRSKPSPFDGRDLVTALSRCNLTSTAIYMTMPTPGKVTLARLFGSVWRRILRAHPDYVVHDVDPSAYGRSYSAFAFRDPPYNLETFVAMSLDFSSSSEHLAPFMVLYWMDLLAQRAAEDAARYARSPTNFHAAHVGSPGTAYKHHWLVGSRGYAVPASADFIDTRFPHRHYLALLLIAFNVHGDFNFSVSHLMAEWLPKDTTVAGCLRCDFIPFDATSIGALQWSIARRMNFSMMVFGDDLVTMLCRYLSFDEMAVVARLADI